MSIAKYFNEKTEKLFDNLYFLLIEVLVFFVIWFFNLSFLLPIVITLLSTLFLIFSNKLRHILSLPIFIMFSLKEYIILGNIPLILIITLVFYSVNLFLSCVKIKKMTNCNSKSNLLFSLICIIISFLLSTVLNYFLYDSEFHLYGTLLCLGLISYLLVFILISFLNKDTNLKDLVNLFYAYNILLLLQLLVCYFKADFPNNFGWSFNKNVPTMALEVFLPFSLYIFASDRKRFPALIVALCDIIWLILLKSRGGLLTTCLLLPLSLYIAIKNKKYYLITLVSLISLSIILIFAIPQLNEKVFELIKNIFNGNIFWNGRDKIWDFSFNAFKSNPIFGKGFSVFYELEKQYRNDRPINSGIFFKFSHNTFLTLMASGGIIAICAYLYHSIAITINIVKIKAHIKYVALYFILFGFIHGLLDNTFFSTVYMFPYFLIFTCNEFNKTTKKKEES